MMDAESFPSDNGKYGGIAELAVVRGLYPFPLGCELLKDARIDIAGDVSFFSWFSGDTCTGNYLGNDPFQPGQMLFAVFLQMRGYGPFLGQFAEPQHLFQEFFLACQPGYVGKTGTSKGYVENQRKQVLFFSIPIVQNPE